MSRPPSSRDDPWQQLRRWTNARVALGRAGTSLPTEEVLRFGLAHALARDAVHTELDTEVLADVLLRQGMRVLQVRSAAPDRRTYLLRPDLGRQLDTECQTRLEEVAGVHELAVVIADGLSASAVATHAPSVLHRLRQAVELDWEAVPVVIARQGRVALGDDIAQALRAKSVAVFIGERPGLSAPDSMGIYYTWSPHVGSLDSERNCISNIRPAGLGYEEAALALAALMDQARLHGVTGVRLSMAAAALQKP